MSASDIINAREGLAKLLEMCQKFGSSAEIINSRESLAAFERLIAEPAVAAPALTVRAHIAAQVAGNLAAQLRGRSIFADRQRR